MIPGSKKVNKAHSLYYKAINLYQDHKPLSQRSGIYSKINGVEKRRDITLNQELLDLIQEVIKR